MRVQRRIYSPEFRSDAVALCRRSDRSFSQVASDIGVSRSTIVQWYNWDEMRRSTKKARPPVVPPPADETPEEKIARLEREVARLRRLNDQLEMDRAILKKAAAFFAKESESGSR
jgi:transposase